MNISDLVTALKPLEGWTIAIVSDKKEHAQRCVEVRKLEPFEREGKEDVVLYSGQYTSEFAPGGVVFLARDVDRVADCFDNLTWIVFHKDGRKVRIYRLEYNDIPRHADTAA